MSRYQEEDGKVTCADCGAPAACPFCEHPGHYADHCRTLIGGGATGSRRECHCYPYPECVVDDMGETCLNCMYIVKQHTAPIAAPPNASKLDHETILKRVLSASQLGFSIHYENGHRWIMYNLNGGANDINLEEQYKKLPRAKCYGSLSDALDTIDVYLKELGFVDNLLDQFRSWDEQWGYE